MPILESKGLYNEPPFFMSDPTVNAPLGIGLSGPPRDTDYANIHAAYRWLGIPPLSAQEELFILTRMRGVSIKAASTAAGMSPSRGSALLKRPEIGQLMEYFREQLFDDARVSLEMLNSMALEAHRKSANATEELKAVETLGRLNEVGGYASAVTLKVRAEREAERDITPKSTKELERMPEDKLMKLAGIEGLESLDPQPLEEEGKEDAPTDVPRGAELDDEEEEEVIEGELVDE